jgi:hypothetical protein
LSFIEGHDCGRAILNFFEINSVISEMKHVDQLREPSYCEFNLCTPCKDPVHICSIIIVRRTFLEDICGGARRGLLRSSSLSQESGVVQLALRGT